MTLQVPRMQFVPVYSGYTCYNDVDEPEKSSKMYRARTYVLKDTEQGEMARESAGHAVEGAGQVREPLGFFCTLL